MLYDKPIPFAEALASRKLKKVLPTSATSAELAKLGPQILERATFSAQLATMGPLVKMDRLLTEMTSPAARQARGLGAIDAGTFRLEMREALAAAGYTPPEGKAGSLLDHRSDARLNLIAKMNTDAAYGYGQHVQANDPDLIDLYPCQELVRIESRKEEREWHERWVRAGGKLHSGRMIARKDSGIWTSISRFGVPYPPFDFNSGMGLREIRRKEAEELGVIKRSDIIKPDETRLTDKVEAAMPKGISPALASVLQSVFSVVAERIILEGIRP
jgi:hypothetical protein